jgi:glucan 1,3-beta-glucosidase
LHLAFCKPTPSPPPPHQILILHRLANAFPYWSDQYLGNSTANLFDQTLRALNHIQTIAGGPNKIHFMIGETGWPTDGGSTYGNAIPNNINAQTYFNEAICLALRHGIDVFMFEAFDEAGKPIVTLPNPNGAGIVKIAETAWGVMDVNRNYRLNLTCPDL